MDKALPSSAAAADLPAVYTVRNRLLALLPAECLQAWGPASELVKLALRQELYQPGDTLRSVHFPLTATIALLRTLGTGECMQVGMVGPEGLVGIEAFMGGRPMTFSALVQSAGAAVRVQADAVREEFVRGGETMRLLLQYTQALLFEISQTAVCKGHHSPQQQLSQWLLLSLDRAATDEIVATHELIGTMLGLRRETVTEAMQRLQALGLVRSGRGRVQVRDRAGLERTACECYAMVRQEYDLLLGPRPAAML